jgi:hypothetical protein
MHVTYRHAMLVGLCALLMAAPARAIEWAPATVQLSDGTTVEGQVYIPRDKILIMREDKPNTNVRVPEMARYDSRVEKQSMEEEWVFKESGLDDKIFTGKHYPVRHYLGTATFHDGSQITGHIMPATLFVKTPEGRDKFILKRKEEGEPGQTLDDLVYVQSIVFHDTAGGVRGSIRGRIRPPDGEKIEKVVALNRTKLYLLEADLQRRTRMFSVEDCTAGTWDVLVLTDAGIYLWFSREADEGCGRIGPETLEEINEWQAKLRDFFHERVVVFAAGSEGRLFGLARMDRRGGTTSPSVRHLRRWEIWSMHKPGDEWQIEKRFFVDREPSKTPLPEPRPVRVYRELGGHVIDADNTEIFLNLDLSGD